MAESAYAAILREHSFVQMPGAEKEIERVHGKLAADLDLPPPKNKPRKRRPNFIIFGSETLAIDEHGQMWKAQGKINLLPFGFENGAELLREVFDRYGDLIQEKLLGGKRKN